MEIPGRASLERSYAERLAALSSKQRGELKRLAGWPPNLADVPESFWDDVAAEAERENAIALYLIYMASADWHFDEIAEDGTEHPASMERGADAFSQALASNIGQRWAAGARDRFTTLVDRVERSVDPKTGKPSVSRSDFNDALIDIIGPSQAAKSAAIGTTAAQTAGGDAGVTATPGDAVAGANDTWSVRPELTKTGPCENCKALDGKKRSEWASVQLDNPEFPPDNGPPLHSYCACEIIHADMPSAPPNR